MPEAETTPRKRFLFGLLSPVILGVLSFLIIGDAFVIAMTGGLGVLLLVGLWAAIRNRKPAFLLGLITSAIVLFGVYVLVWWLNHRS